MDDFTKSLHAGASFLKRTFYGSSDPALRSTEGGGSQVKIVEKVESMGGVNRFVSVGGMTQTVGGVVTSRAPMPSPLLQLSNLIRAQATPVTSSDSPQGSSTSQVIASGGIMAAPRITSPGERRPHPPIGAPMGIPGHPGSGHLDHRLTQLKPGQRLDLGTVGGSRPRPKTLGTIPPKGGLNSDDKMGTVNWTSMGRKGGLL